MNGAFQHLEANHMIAVVKNGMFAFVVLHDLGVPVTFDFRNPKITLLCFALKRPV